jgi:hypothetical protein
VGTVLSAAPHVWSTRWEAAVGSAAHACYDGSLHTRLLPAAPPVPLNATSGTPPRAPQVQDVVATVESVQQLMVVERDTHWAGAPGQKLVLAEAFRSLVRQGELTLVSP